MGRQGIDISIPKGGSRKKGVMVPIKPETWQGKFHEILSLKNNPFWFTVLPSPPTGDGGPASEVLPLCAFLKPRGGPEDPKVAFQSFSAPEAWLCL